MSFFKNKQNKNEENESEANQQTNEEPLSDEVMLNLTKLQTIFSYPTNNALQIRNLFLPIYDKSIVVLSIEGTVDVNLIDTTILQPLLRKSDGSLPNIDFVSLLLTTILPTADAKLITTVNEVQQSLVNGSTVILVDNEACAVSIDTVKFENRSVSEPTTETTIIGPKAAFNESAAVNRSLLRKQIRNPNFFCDPVTIGQHSEQEVSVMYIKNIADNGIVEEVIKRLKAIETDAILTLSQVEQYIEERPYSIFPTTLMTERPDRAASFILEGHVVLIMENSPTALIVPTTFWSFIHTVEDQYLRMPYGNFLRTIRLIALFIALLTPALYIAVTTFHTGMIPTDLMLAIAATRERIPFPVIAEIIIMEVAFEILREAGVRVPTTLGPTIGIVGALILGQAAVEANLISPILVVIVAITGLSSFTIPDVSFNISIRMLRFVFLFSAYLFGFFGIAIVGAFLLAYLVSMKSFGVSFFEPLSPHYPSSKDLLARPPIWKQWIRPMSMSPKQKARAPKPKGDGNNE
ncbi:spore germination protein [Sporosarcina pasteurii]|uniref:Bacillus/Clostridium GerA spore germination protein n=1 Tax=Sporosarcina pasteurii TaxID=1474 RepID=A0A380C3I5_SPOPA|nr:spore germination protein [Sporosarcina pasteurii]MDS9471682.1 spore germination protein [Sporosarcina pasteurii]QBQ04717.1 spore germination protein [Sporosarcina pasteurii]SUJ11992.1 Bacillus/Clostridium GerA spore germination protein [Sporosarcina pasteurii]